MSKVYTVSDILWHKMFDYGYKSVRQMASENGIKIFTLRELMDDTREYRMITGKVFRKICAAFDILPSVLYSAMNGGWRMTAQEEDV